MKIYKTRESNLPTVLYDGPTFYDFQRVGPDRWEFQTDDQKVIDKLLGMGYLTDPVEVQEPVPELEEEAPGEVPKAIPAKHPPLSKPGR